MQVPAIYGNTKFRRYVIAVASFVFSSCTCTTYWFNEDAQTISSSRAIGRFSVKIADELEQYDFQVNSGLKEIDLKSLNAYFLSETISDSFHLISNRSYIFRFPSGDCGGSGIRNEIRLNTDSTYTFHAFSN